MRCLASLTIVFCVLHLSEMQCFKIIPSILYNSGMSTVHRLTFKEILFLPLGCLISSPPMLVIGILALGVMVAGFGYYNWNIDLLGIGAPDFQNLIFSSDSQRITNPDGSYYNISFEKAGVTQFSGLVRHISPIRIGRIPILTHDILVTYGDFADPAKVTTSVIDHHFFWSSAEMQHPQGGINLLHTVPKDDQIYRQLLEIKAGQTVRISGREILRLDAYSSSDHLDMYWQDSGCNSLIVDSVAVEK
jgi:hypothetical protein